MMNEFQVTRGRPRLFGAAAVFALALMTVCGEAPSGEDAGEGHGAQPQASDFQSVQLTPDYAVQNYRFLYFGAQPDIAALEAAKEQGIRFLVSFREESETDFNEKAEAEKLGLEYRNFPVPSEGAGYPEASIAAMESFLEENHGEPMLLHCSSGNRAASWFGVHLMQAHGMNADESLELAKAAGLNKADAIERFQKYAGAGAAGE